MISFDKMGLRRLQRIMGNALNPIIGQYDGYYDLDLSKANDRVCLTKLLIQSEHTAKVNQGKCVFHEGRTKDCSQKGDWSSFRNARIGGRYGQVSVDLFNPMPLYGHVSFDFCGANKPPREAAVIKDTRCVSVLINLSLVEREQREALLEELDQMREVSRHDIHFDGSHQPINSKARADDIQLCMCKFYDRLPMRSTQFAKAIELEEVKFGSDGTAINVAAAVEEDVDSDDSSDSISHVVFGADDIDHVCRHIQSYVIRVLAQLHVNRFIYVLNLRGVFLVIIIMLNAGNETNDYQSGSTGARYSAQVQSIQLQCSREAIPPSRRDPESTTLVDASDIHSGEFR